MLFSLFCSQTLSICCLKHCVALWQLLASLKSEKMLRLKGVRHRHTDTVGWKVSLLFAVAVLVIHIVHFASSILYNTIFCQDPFVEVSETYKVALGEDEHRLLTGFFSKSSGDNFLLEMHEFLLLVLKKPNAPDTYKPDWR